MRFRHFLLLISFLYGAAFLLYHRWDTNILYGGDSWGYYAYLPAFFIYHDLESPLTTYRATGRETGYIPALPEPGGELNEAENGNYIIKYTCGIALLELPFFLAGHLLAGLLNQAQSGYSFPYLISVHLAVFIYLFIGLFCLYQVLIRQVKPRIALLTLAILCLATNLHFFTVYSGLMAHAFLFALYGLLMLATVRFYEKPVLRWAVLIGLSAGLITLIRPVEAICVLIPILYGLGGGASVKSQWLFIGKHLKFFLIATGLFLLCALPQLLYWKVSTGHWWYYSYGEEGFNWLKPNLQGGLFSFKNGWLTYTPVMWLSLGGLCLLRRARAWRWPISLFLLLHLYITYSWWCWYYINGFGSRPMVEAYALLAIPLALVLQAAYHKKWPAIAMSILLTGFALLNLFQTWQTKAGILLSEAATRGYYWSVFGKTKLDYGDLAAFDSREQQPDTASLQRRGILLELDFESGLPGRKFSESVVYQGRQSLILEPWDSIEVWNANLNEKSLLPGGYLLVQAWCYKEILEFPWYEMPFIAISLERNGEIRRHRVVRIDNKLGNPRHNLWGGKADTWGLVKMYMHIPAHFRPDDRVRVYLQAQGQRVYVDGLSLEVWER